MKTDTEQTMRCEVAKSRSRLTEAEQEVVDMILPARDEERRWEHSHGTVATAIEQMAPRPGHWDQVTAKDVRVHRNGKCGCKGNA